MGLGDGGGGPSGGAGVPPQELVIISDTVFWVGGFGKKGVGETLW